MDNYPSKRRKISPFTSILVRPSDTPTEPANHHEEHAPKLTSDSSTQAKLTWLDPNEVHPLAPFIDSLQKKQNRSTPPTEGNSFQESTNGILCENEASSQREPRNNIQAEQPTAHAELLDGSPEVIFGRNGVLHETGTLRHSSPEANQHPTLLEKSHAAMAAEPRASPPTPDADKMISELQLEKSNLKSAEMDQSAHMANGTITEGQHALEQEPFVEPEPELPFTPTKQSLDALEPRLPSTPTQLGLEAPPTPPKGLASAASPRRLRKKRQIMHKSSPLKVGDSFSTDKADQVPYVSNLGPRVPVVNIRRSGQMFTLSAEHVSLRMEKLGTGLSKQSESTADAEVYNMEAIEQTPSLAERLALFLPFSRPVASTQSSATPYEVPSSDNPLDVTAAQPPEIQQAESLEHHLPSTSSTTVIDGPGPSLIQPNSMTVAESLDYSRLPDISSHGLEITFASHQQLLVVNIQLMIDKVTGKSTNFKITSISPWADSELGLWLRNEAQSLPRATIERAIKNYWETSLIRASCWQRCEEDIGGATARTKPPILINSSTNEPELNPNPLKKKTRGKPIVFPPVPESPRSLPETTNSPPLLRRPTSSPTSPNPNVNQHYLLQAHLGRRFLLFTQPPISLLIAWHITIAPDGTSRNHISAHPAYPKRWIEDNNTEKVQGRRRGQEREQGRRREPGQEQGEGGGEGEALGQIVEAFDALLAHRGVFDSIKELCSRVFPTG